MEGTSTTMADNKSVVPPLVGAEYDVFEMIKRLVKRNPSLKHEVIRTCLDFLYLFPQNYEFHKDDIIQLWEAEVIDMFFQEYLAHVYFEAFERANIFISSRFDHATGRPRYKLNNSVFLQIKQVLIQQGLDRAYFRVNDVKSSISERTRRASVDGIDPITLNYLYRAKILYTLLIHGSRIDHVPRQLFIKLPLVNVLDLSHTGITELPSSIGNLKHLTYLNLSGTPITTLPSSLCSLDEMRTLKLRGCLKLIALPKEMGKLTELRHLDVDVACLMVSMPIGLGKLTRLQTLPAFMVGKENGCHITELQYLENLRGTLRILRLENVSNSVEALNAAVHEKEHINKLELQWTEVQDEIDFEVLENLQPHTQLEELQIVGFAGFEFPSWIGDPLFSNLVTITLHDCKKSQLLPPLGKLPSLKCLCISDMDAVKVIDSRFCGRDRVAGLLDLGRILVLKAVAPFRSESDNMFGAFPRLKNFTLNGMPMLEKWSGMEKGDFQDLLKLNISDCSKLKALPKLVLLESLQHLEISLCPLLESFPNKGLPTSLQYLVIIDCPLIKGWCHKEAGSGGKLAHVPNVWIDYQQISPKPSAEQDEDAETNNRIDILDTEASNSESISTIKTTDKKDMQIWEDVLVTRGKNTMQPNIEEMDLGNKAKGANRKYGSSDGRDLSDDSGGKLSSPTPQSEGKKWQSSYFKSFSFAQLKNATQDFRPDCVLGENHFGTVFKGWIDEDMLSATKPGKDITESRKGIAVAVQILKRASFKESSGEWLKEVNYLGQLYHPNIVKLLGYCGDDEHRLLVYEFMPLGSLENHLFGPGGFPPVSWRDRMKIALGAAKGVAYLHSIKNRNSCRHFKPYKILLDSDYNAKLSGFVPGEDEIESYPFTAETHRYAAPEFFRTGPTSESDVYSFGVLLLEMLIGQRFHGLSGERDLMHKIFFEIEQMHDEYPVRDAHNAVELAHNAVELVHQCLSPEEHLRPDMYKIVKALEELQDSKDRFRTTFSITSGLQLGE